MTLPEQHSLSNFYQSLAFRDPLKATLMSEDVMTVALNAAAFTTVSGQEAANRLREKSRDLDELLRHMLENALTELGYL